MRVSIDDELKQLCWREVDPRAPSHRWKRSYVRDCSPAQVQSDVCLLTSPWFTEVHYTRRAPTPAKGKRFAITFTRSLRNRTQDAGIRRLGN